MAGSKPANHARWRLRGVALAASAILVAATLALLIWASRTTALYDDWRVTGVEVMLDAKQHPPPPQRTRTEPRNAGAPIPAPTARPNADPVLAQMLNCFNRRQHERDPRCPPTQAHGPDYTTRGQLPVGSDFAPTPPINFNAGLSRGEQMAGLAHAAPCATDGGGASVGVCARLPPPPPPSRTAVEICEAGGLGPCHPPDVPVARAAHTD